MNVIGEIKIFAGEFVPPDFVDCDGTAYPIPLYKELFSVVGYSYTPEVGSGGGGGGRFGLKYFRVPSMDVLIQGTKFIICVNGYFPRERLLEIYNVPTSELSYTDGEQPNPRALGQINNKLKDPKGKKLIEYDAATWQNYNLDTDEFE
jgi:microcystin-dependent protein